MNDMSPKEIEERKHALSEEFRGCRKAFVAIGDEVRQEIIMALLEADCSGLRVGEITSRTRLSRPAVSHHLQVLKDAGIINMYRKGTRNYYYIDPDQTLWGRMSQLFIDVCELVQVFADEMGDPASCDRPNNAGGRDQ
jgi:DNA-binding transcriptional ArsR family regulator